jgi:hypothetical protein
MTEPIDTVTLFRPLGPDELRLIEAQDWAAFPPRLPEQPIFYPVTNFEYAREIAEHWNVRDQGCGYVVQFELRADYISQFDAHKVGAKHHTEYWIPAAELEEFNRNIVGRIKLVAQFSRGDGCNDP